MKIHIETEDRSFFIWENKKTATKEFLEKMEFLLDDNPNNIPDDQVTTIVIRFSRD